MRPVIVTFLLVALAFAGCLSGSTDETPAPSTGANNTTIIVDANRPATAAGDVTTGPAAAPDTQATLEKVPEIKVGEWWRIKMVSPLDGTDVEIVRVMAKVDGEHYIMGMPHEGWFKEAVVYHVPFFGEVSRADLSGHAHNIPFEPLKFPLHDGDTWETSFETPEKLTATVKVLDATTAEITYKTTKGVQRVKGVYDATIHEFRSMDVGFLQYEVVAHGYDFQGWVTVPRGEKLVFLHGRIAGALDVNLKPAPPMEEMTIDEEFNRVTFVQIAGIDVTGTNQANGKGVYRATVTDPQGKVYQTEVIAGQGYKVQFFESANVTGKWKLEHVAGGPGLAFTEGIAYHQYDISVPDGRIRTDHSHAVIR